VDETVTLAIRGRRLLGRLSTQVFACAPRKITVADFDNIDKQIAEASILRLGPSTTAPVVRLPDGPMRFVITEVKGGWMRVQVVPPSGPRTPTQFRGWIQAVDAASQWSLRRRMPELYFVEGVAQYLAANVQGERGPRDQWLADGAEAIDRYLSAWGEGAVLGNDAAAGGTPLAVAVPRQVRAFISFARNAAPPDVRLADAREQFDRAATLVPQSSHARNLVTITRVAQTYLKPSANQPPRPFVDDLGNILGADPGNATVLSNLRVLYDLVLDAVQGEPASWALPAAERDQLTRQRESLKVLKSS
jgi:hypothetical protein